MIEKRRRLQCCVLRENQVFEVDRPQATGYGLAVALEVGTFLGPI